MEELVAAVYMHARPVLALPLLVLSVLPLHRKSRQTW